jgi:hypothetical protein
MNILETTFSATQPPLLTLLRKLKRLSLKENDVTQKKSPMQKQQKIERRGKRKKKRLK